MQERGVTVGGNRMALPAPFFVLATQNPIEQEGTYPLPEAQLDRFMFNIPLTYPSYEEEIQVVKNTTANRKVEVRSVVNAEEILAFQQLVRKIPIADNVLEYAVGLAAKTRPNTAMATAQVNEYISWGCRSARLRNISRLEPRCTLRSTASTLLMREDVQAVAPYVLRHRIVRNFRAEAEGVDEEAVIRGAILVGSANYLIGASKACLGGDGFRLNSCRLNQRLRPVYGWGCRICSCMIYTLSATH